MCLLLALWLASKVWRLLCRLLRWLLLIASALLLIPSRLSVALVISALLRLLLVAYLLAVSLVISLLVLVSWVQKLDLADVDLCHVHALALVVFVVAGF